MGPRDAALRDVEVYGPEWQWVLDTAPEARRPGAQRARPAGVGDGETGWAVAYEDDALAASAGAVELHGSLRGVRPDQAPEVILPGAGLRGGAPRGHPDGAPCRLPSDAPSQPVQPLGRGRPPFPP